MIDNIESIDYVQYIDGASEYSATTDTGETYTVIVETYYTSDHSLIARGHADGVPGDVVDAVEEYVQEEYDS